MDFSKAEEGSHKKHKEHKKRSTNSFHRFENALASLCVFLFFFLRPVRLPLISSARAAITS
jgi:hypothetical protein